MKDTNSTMIVGLAALVVVASATLLAITYSHTDPVVLIAFAGTIVTGIFSILRAGQAADQAAHARDRASEAKDATQATGGKVEQVSFAVNGRMDELLRVTREAAGLLAARAERDAAEERASAVKAASDLALAIAQASPAIIPSPVSALVPVPSVPVQVTIVPSSDTPPLPVAIVEDRIGMGGIAAPRATTLDTETDGS